MKWTIKFLSFCLALCPLMSNPVASAVRASSVEKELRTDSAGVRQDVGNQRPLPSGVRAEKVRFDGDGLKLAGTVFIPKLLTGRRAPALLLISGSDHQRKGPVPIARAPLGAFAELGEYFAGNGMVVLTYDTRCNGSSECRTESTPHEYASDAGAAYRYLSGRADVDAAKLIVIGHDEGGGFAAVVSAHPPEGTRKPLGVVLIGVPGRTYGKLLREHANKRLLLVGKSEAEINAYLAKFDLLANALSRGDSNLKGVDQQDPLFTQFVANRSYLFHLFVNDPLQVVRGIGMPVLIIQGEKDAHVGVKDAQYLKESLGRQYNENVSLEVLPELDHWMRAPKGPVVFRDEESTGPLDPLFISLLKGWIAKLIK